MKKISYFLISLFTAFGFTACTDGLDNIEYSSDSGIVASAPVVSEKTGFSLTVTSTASGDVNNIVKKGFCYSLNVQNPTIKDNVLDADENFSVTISGLKATLLIMYVLISTVTAVTYIRKPLQRLLPT